jgi:ribosome-binding protein aMBF1 (putative translation factor)
MKGIDIYKVTLEDLGDYTFNIFQKDQKFLRLVSRYIITRNDHKEEIEEDVKEVLEVIKEERENAGTDVSDLERHINEQHQKSFVDGST